MAVINPLERKLAKYTNIANYSNSEIQIRTIFEAEYFLTWFLRCQIRLLGSEQLKLKSVSTRGGYIWLLFEQLQ